MKSSLTSQFDSLISVAYMLFGFEDDLSQAMKLGLLIHGPIFSPVDTATIPEISAKLVIFFSPQLWSNL